MRELTALRNLVQMFQEMKYLESALTLVANAEPTLRGNEVEIARLQKIQAEIREQTERDRYTAQEAKREAEEATENLIKEINACKTKLALQVSNLEAQAADETKEIKMALLKIQHDAEQEKAQHRQDIEDLRAEVAALSEKRAELTAAIARIKQSLG